MVLVQQRLRLSKILFLYICLSPAMIFVFTSVSILSELIPILSVPALYFPTVVIWMLLLLLIVSPWIVLRLETTHENIEKQINLCGFTCLRKTVAGGKVYIEQYVPPWHESGGTQFYRVLMSTEKGSICLISGIECWLFGVTEGDFSLQE